MTIHWTSWKDAVNACANVGKATLAMLVPSEDSNMDSERLASAHRAEDVRSVYPAIASSRPAIIGFNMSSVFQSASASEESGCALDSCVGAYPFRRTGLHFSGICTGDFPSV